MLTHRSSFVTFFEKYAQYLKAQEVYSAQALYCLTGTAAGEKIILMHCCLPMALQQPERFFMLICQSVTK